MLTALHQQVRRTIRRYDLLPDGAKVLIGLSGGSDSVALTALLMDLSRHGGFAVVGCAHLNHQLRLTSARDEEFCLAYASALRIPIHIRRVDVGSFAADHGMSTEVAARKSRYSVLSHVAQEVGADRIAVGHTRDDQAETFLMKLMRGAGPAGLGGIYPRRGQVIRPLLDVSREELRAWLSSRGSGWVEDETNADVENPRNRIRLNVLPELARALGGDPRSAIGRAAALLREDGEWLLERAQQDFRVIARETPEGLTFDAVALAALPGPIESRVLRTGLIRLGGDREVTQEHVEAARAVLRGLSTAADVPGGRVELSGRLLVLLDRRAASK